MSNKIDVSIIIPIKNMERYLQKCLASIVHENEINIEILLIDFGSTDNTLDIAEKYQEIDNRIKTIIDNNGDAASARDIGIKHAHGEYITFIDADDWLEEGMLAKLYKEARVSAVDIISARYQTVVEDNQKILSQSRYYTFEEKINQENLDDILCRIAKGELNLELWNKLYRRNFIVDNNIHLNSKNGINGEDTLFNIECIFAKPYIKAVDIVYYNHLIRENSLANSKGKKLSLRFMTIIDILKNKMNFQGYKCDNGLSQIMMSLLIQDILDSLKDENGVRDAINIYEQFSFYEKYLNLIIVSRNSTIKRKLLSLIMKKHKYKLIAKIFRERG